MRVKSKNRKSIIYLGILLLIMGLTIGFSAFQNQLFINDMSINVRLQRDVRISESTISKVSGATTYSDNYNKTKLLGDVDFDSTSSYILYKVNLTNYGNVKSGLNKITGTSGMSYSICNSSGGSCTTNYETAICNGSNCTLGASKEIYVKVTSNSAGRKNIDLDFDIEPYNSITYEYFNENTSSFKPEILSNSTYELTLTSKPEEVEISGTGEIDYNKNTGKLTISNVGSDIVLHAKYSANNIANTTYTGSDPNNYVRFNNSLYRIITKENVNDGYGNTELRIKLVKHESIGNYAFDTSTNEYANSDIKTTLNTTFYNSLSDTAKEQIDTVSWTSLSVENIGLIDSDDYTNNSTWLSYETYTLTQASGNKIVAITNNGLIDSDLTTQRAIHPSVYLINDILIVDGSGSSTDPYILELPSNGLQPNPTRIEGKTLTVTGSSQELVSVTNKIGTPRYSLNTPLNESNYSSASTSVPTASNVNEYSIYYYIPAWNNYKAKSGMVTSRINGITYTVSYTAGANIDSIGASSGSCTTSGSSLSCSVTLPTITPSAGYENGKWSDGSNLYNPNASYTLNSNGKTLTATVSGKTYVATFVKNGATAIGSTSLSCTVTSGSSCSITLPSITRDGYQITGWANSASATTGAGVNTTATLTGNTTFYAITKKEVTITFNKNGNTSQTISGQAASTANTVTQSCTMWNTDENCNITSPAITPASGFTTLGYSVAADNRTITWNESTQKSVSSSTTYFAQSKKNEVKRTITFNKNGNSGFTYNSTSYTDNSKTFDACTIPATYNGDSQGSSCSATITLPTIQAHSNTPTLIGWSTGTTVRTATYTSGQSNVTISFDSNKTFYAQTSKSAVERKITFYKNNNIGFTYNSTAYTDNSKSFTACTIGVVYNGASQSSSCEATINMPTIQAHNNTQNIIGWSSGANNHTASYSSGQSNVSITMNSDKSYYAQTSAQAKTITITFNVNGNGGSNSTPSCTIDATYNGASQATSCSITSPDITPASGFTKIGWNSNQNTHTSEWNVNTSKDVSSNKTYYAQSIKASVVRKITFYKNTATSFTYNSTRYTDTSKTFDACTISEVYNGASQATSCTATINMPTIEAPTGYSNNGWGTSAGATSPAYNSGQTNASITMNANKSYYALTKANQLTFDDQSISKSYSSSSQTASITAASNGTGTYTYAEKSEKIHGGSNTSYISLSGTTITIAANTPANTYDYVITATDSNSGASKDATYTITINKIKPVINPSATTKALTYKTSGTITYTYNGDGTVRCTSSDTEYVTCSVNTGTQVVTITPVKATSSAVDITLSATAGTNYSAPDNKTISVTVAKFTPTVTLTSKTGMVWNNSSHAANTATVTLTNSETYSGTITYTYYTNNACSTGATTTAPTLAGNYYVKASIASQTNYNAASSSCVAHTIDLASPTVSLSAKTDAQRTYTGSSIASNTATVSPNGGGSITYNYYSNSSCTGTPSTTAPTNAGTYSVKASVAAVNGKTNAAESSCVNHSILKANPTFSVQSSLSLTYKTAQTIDYTYNGDGNVTCSSSDTSYITCSVNTSTKKLTVTPVKATSSAVTVTLSAAEGSNYNAGGNKTISVTVAKYTPTVSLSAKTEAQRKYTGSAITANTATVTLTNSETYSGTITYTYYTNNSCTTGATTTAPTYGAYWVKASIAAQVNYNAAASGCVNHNIVAATPTVTLVAKTEAQRTYTGSAITANTATVSPDGGGAITYNYYTGSSCTGTPSTTAPTTVGTYRVQAVVAEVPNRTTAATSSCVDHSIISKKATIGLGSVTSLNVTYKTPETFDFTYDGDGTVSCSSSLSSNATCVVDQYSKKITVTPVTYTSTTITMTVSATAGTNYSAADNKTFTVILNKFTPTVSLSAKSEAQRTFTGSAIAANTATVTLTNNETYSGTITYTYYTNSSCTTGSTTTVPTYGNYWVKASIAAQTNYNAASSVCVNHNIVPATPTVTLTEKTGMIYNGSRQATNTATVSPNGGGTITYNYYTGTSCTGTSTTTAPTNAGTYRVKATVAAVNGKTNAAESSCVAHVISPKSLTSTQITAYSTTWVSGSTTYTRSVSTGVGSETVSLTYTPYSNTVGSYTYATSSGSGKYTLSQSNTNYSISSAGNFTLTRAASSLSINPTSGTLTYGTNATATITKTGDGTLSCESSNTNVATCQVSGTTLTITPANTSTDGATATITVHLSAGTNYAAAADVTYSATVNRRQTTLTGTFYYNSSTTSGTLTVATKTATCTLYNNDTSCTLTVPTEVTNSVGKYGSAYKNVSLNRNDMTAASLTISENKTFYAFYSGPVVIHYPTSTTTQSTTTYYRNEFFTSNTVMSPVIAQNQASTQNYSITSNVNDFSIGGFASTFNSYSVSYNSVSSLAYSGATEVYEILTKAVTATIYYNSSTTIGTLSLATTTATSNQRILCTETGAEFKTYAYSIPSVVTNSVGPYGNSYRYVSSSLNSVANNNSNQYTTLYAIYSSNNVTLYYYGASYMSKTLYRTSVFTSVSGNGTMATTLSDSLSLSNYSPISGPNSSVWSGLSTGQDTTVEYSTVEAAANSSSTTLYSVYSLNASFVSGTGVSSITPSSTSCKMTTDATTCTVTPTSIEYEEGYSYGEWTASGSGATYAEDDPLVVTTNNQTFTLNGRSLRMYRCPDSRTPVYNYGGYRANRYGSYQSDCQVYTACSGSTYDTCNWTPRCPDIGSCYDVLDEQGNRTMTCCTCPCHEYNCPTGISSYTYNLGEWQTSKYGDYQEQCEDNGGEIALNTATFYYNSNTTNGSLTVSTVESSCQTEYGNSCSISVPASVTSSIGKYNGPFKGIANTANTMTSVNTSSVSINDSSNFYTTYSNNNVTNYYYDGSYKTRTLYKNEYFTSTSDMNTVLATSSNLADNYTTAVGPGSSVWTGLSTAQDTTTEYSDVASAAISNSTTLYSVYQFNVNYSVGSNTSSISQTTDSCKVTTGSTSCSVTLPIITSNTGYHDAGWSTTNGDANGTASQTSYTLSANNQTLYGNSDGNTYTATFYYWNGTQIATATNSCKVTSGSTCTVTVPTTVSSSSGKYGGTYVNVALTTSTMTAGSLVMSGDKTLYAYYSKALTIYYPSSTTARGTYNYKRNEVFTSNTEITGYVNSSATAVTNININSAVSGYTVLGFANTYGENDVGSITTVAALGNNSLSTAYVVLRKTVTATFRYNTNATSGSLTVGSTTADGYQFVRTTSSAAQIYYGPIEIPSVVSSSIGKYNSTYRCVNNATATLTSVSPTTQYTSYYAVYSEPVTNYYYNSTAHTTTTLYRNEWFTSTTATSQALATSNDSKTNYTTATGPGSSVWAGLSTGADTTAEYTTVATAATSNSNTLYTVYTMTTKFVKGTGVSSVSPASTTCSIVSKNNGNTTCTVTPATITLTAGYENPYWIEGDTGATLSATDPIVASVHNRTYTAYATKDAIAPQASVSSTATLKATSQTATLTCSDANGVTSYYWGTAASGGTFTTVTSTTNMTVTKNVTSKNTYYLRCKDAAGNISTNATITYNQYKVRNMLQNTTGSTYTSTHYTISGSEGTYFVPTGTTLTLSDIYTIPTGSRAGRFMGYSVGAASTTAATPVTSNPTLSADTTYSMWFTRNVVNFTYQVQNDETLTATTSSEGNTYTWTKGLNNIVMQSINGATAQTLTTSFRYGVTTMDIANYNNTGFLNITKGSSVAVSSSEWICVSGCKTSGQTFNMSSYTVNFNNFCDNFASSDCNIVVKVNWKVVTYKCPTARTSTPYEGYHCNDLSGGGWTCKYTCISGAEFNCANPDCAYHCTGYNYSYTYGTCQTSQYGDYQESCSEC